jgi:2'-5' RNA ligase
VKETLRVFIAIELDDAVRVELKRVQKQLQDECRRTLVTKDCVRWVAPQNIHLTLKFFGKVDRAQIPALGGVLEKIAETVAPFELTARGLGCFPNARRPNDVWVGLTGDVERAARLTRRIEDECVALGFARDERGFTPHLTLGRVKREASNAGRAALGELVKKFPLPTLGNIQAHELFLIQSDLQPGGPIYTVLSQARLIENTNQSSLIKNEKISRPQ